MWSLTSTSILQLPPPPLGSLGGTVTGDRGQQDEDEISRRVQTCFQLECLLKLFNIGVTQQKLWCDIGDILKSLRLHPSIRLKLYLN